MSGRDKAVDQVVQAWSKPGSHPSYHREMQGKLLAEWPTLAHALISLANADAGDEAVE